MFYVLYKQYHLFMFEDFFLNALYQTVQMFHRCDSISPLTIQNFELFETTKHLKLIFKK